MTNSETHEALRPQDQLKNLRLEFMSLFEEEQKAPYPKSHSKSTDQGLNVLSLAQLLLTDSWQDKLGVTAAQLAQQQVKTYAQEKPLQLVGWAALLGAGVVLIKPWRYLPAGVSGLLGTALVNRIYKVFSSP